MTEAKPSLVAGVGHVDEVLPNDLNFKGKTRKRHLSPSKRRAAARTKTLSVNVNPKLYETWNAIREDKELSVVRALELSLIAYLEQSGKTFEL
ncbi:hypothetical protein [Shimia thalassica]|uniref:hypothetical protein n=1 Tax=Shimia thalassica TaxID=1715693 RepID=UPI0026E36997|nr:hypothetical protein [Shimia thalassica]MDO6481416.1 hypothetical protein [Shimia thalassica]